MTPDEVFPYDLIVVLGPTASGKTRLGVGLARAIGGEIISADSRQVYRGMDIGTGKDLEEYGDIPCHLIDIIPPGEGFSLFQFQRRFLDAFGAIREQGKVPVMVGGTGLYIQSVLQGYKLVETPPDPVLRNELSGLTIPLLAKRLESSAPTLHNTTDLLDRDRLIRAIEIAEFEKCHKAQPMPEIRAINFGIHWDRAVLRQRITARLRERLNQGMVEEVERLNKSGVPWETLEFYGLEYRFIARHLQGKLNRNDMFQKLNSAIHDFAKRQETWFRRMERQGVEIRWLDGAGDPLGVALEILKAEVP